MEIEVEFNDLGTFGTMPDRPSYQLPPEAWSFAHNMRIIDGVPWRLSGYSQCFGTPGTAPHFAMTIADPNTPWWLYTSLTAAYAYDGSTHYNITRAAGASPYTASNGRDWNGTMLGGVPILNNGADVPQFWASYSSGTDLADLTNWPSTLRAKIIRSFGPYLVAFNISKSGTRYPHMAKWSHSADPGSVPSSWDETDETKDTGEKDLPDVESGEIVTAMMLSGQMYVYKESSVWRMRLIGGRFIFAFDSFLEGLGALGPRAVCLIANKNMHLFVAADDIYVHNGSSHEPILTKKWKKTFYEELDAINYRNTFVFDNPQNHEVWICYPTSGNEFPNKALIWNYKYGKDGAFTTADCNFRYALVGNVQTSDNGTWNADDVTWEENDIPWDSSLLRRIVVCDPSNTKFYVFDGSPTRNGVDFTSTLRREGLSFVGRNFRTGEYVVDVKKIKTMKRMWLKVTGDSTDLRVRFGASMGVRDTTTWNPRVVFDPATQDYFDQIITGRLVGFELRTVSGYPWGLEGYKLEVNVGGHF